MNNKHYDYIFLGTGIISIIEAIYYKKSGYSVKMIESKNNFGGAWRPIDIFDIKGVENSIHYFLFDKKSPTFMQNNLKWNIIKTTNKVRLFKIFKTNVYLKFEFHNPIGLFLFYLIKYDRKRNKNLFKFLYNIIIKVIRENSEYSFYIRGGANEIHNKMKKLIKEAELDICYNTFINSIYVDSKKKKFN